MEGGKWMQNQKGKCNNNRKRVRKIETERERERERGLKKGRLGSEKEGCA